MFSSTWVCIRFSISLQRRRWEGGKKKIVFQLPNEIVGSRMRSRTWSTYCFCRFFPTEYLLGSSFSLFFSFPCHKTQILISDPSLTSRPSQVNQRKFTFIRRPSHDAEAENLNAKWRFFLSSPFPLLFPPLYLIHEKWNAMHCTLIGTNTPFADHVPRSTRGARRCRVGLGRHRVFDLLFAIITRVSEQLSAACVRAAYWNETRARRLPSSVDMG